MTTNGHNTFVILYPKDHNGAFHGDVTQLTEMLRVQGVPVEVIGDGNTVLDINDVRTRLQSVHGTATLYIAAHGANDPKTGLHVIDGFARPDPSSQVLNTLTLGGYPVTNSEGLISSASLFDAVPNNYRAVLQGSCYSAAALKSASNNLPQGTLFFPIASSDHVGYGGSLKQLTSLSSLSTRPITVSDLFLSELISSHSAERLGYTSASTDFLHGSRTYGAPVENPSREEIEKYLTHRSNIPEGVAVGGRESDGGSILKVKDHVQRLRGHQFTPQQITQVADRLQNVLFANGNDLIVGQDESLGRENLVARDHHQRRVANIMHQISTGTISESSHEYAYAYAVAYAMGGLDGDNALSRDVELAKPQLSDTLDTTETMRRDGTFYRTTKYERELAGLAEELTRLGYMAIVDKTGKSVLDRDHDGKLSMEDIQQVLRDKGVYRSEDIGNRDREITAREFVDFAGGTQLPNLRNRSSETPER